MIPANVDAMPRWNSGQSKPSPSARSSVDHRIGLVCGARAAADRHAAFHDAVFGALHQRDHFTARCAPP
ncbi:hypothetical protein AS156_28165 [Bradyrhizobium macuxiense]|uniref:Uncharacterized protein n=1 Tax=Bradyrhizobium macuxiense TaxID=1755647 RepID=A0A120FRT2_9BRAD|nr:hypothetical protein AS156_28165 [Bradyrhizobium macuxiense]